MLSIGKLTGGAGSVDYYEHSVANGREDYYTGQGESEGRWIGTAADELGLRGTVATGALRRLLVEGEHPITGRQLRVRDLRVHAFDLTFSAPKSVSVLFAVGSADQRAAMVRAHEHAVRDALGYLERNAAQVRRGAGGTVVERASGFIAAAYRHRTSRAGDPQLHTHVVTANLARGRDGRWTALHATPLFAHARTAGYLYQATLRDQLGRELGVRFSPPVRGAGEILGIPKPVLQHFSTRRAEIREAMSVRGTTTNAAARVATLQTRRAKQHPPAESSIYERWQARAAEHGLDAERLAHLLAHDPTAVTTSQLRALAESMAGNAGLTAHASSFTRREVLQEWASTHTAGESIARLEQLADRWLASDLVVQIDGDAPEEASTSQLDDTRAPGREARFSTPQMLEAERTLIAGAADRTSEAVAVASQDALDHALAARPYLAAEQQDLVTDLVTSGHGVQVVLAKAGSGKTTALDAARDAWQRSGIDVQGAALSSYAAQELRDSGIDATTIARLLMDMQRHPLPQGSVLIIDEAGMVGTHTLKRLAAHAAQSDLKLVLVGDDHQLPEIDAGGAFRGLATRLGANRLQHNRRQTDPEDRRALDAYRSGDPADLISSLQRRGRLTIGDTVGQTHAALVSDWWTGVQAVGIANATMVTLRRNDARELNELARQQLRDADHLKGDELVLANRDAFAVGDQIVTRRPNRAIDIANGTRAQITHLAPDGGIRARLANGRDVTLPADYVTSARNGQPAIEHGYAVTAHRLQGGTTDRTYVLGSDAAYREWGYVAFSRHREQTRFYVTAPEVPEHAMPEPDEPSADPLEPILRGLRRTRAQELASDIAAAGELHLAPHEELQAEVEYLRNVLADAPTASVIALERIDEALTNAVEAHSEALAQLQRVVANDLAPTHERPQREQVQASVEQLAATAHRLRQQRETVRARGGDPDGWLAAHAYAARRLTDVDRELTRRHTIRHAEALRLVTIAPPGYVTAELGDRPEEPSQRRIWDRSARTIEQYRLAHGRGLTDADRGLGPRPRDRSSQRAYFAADRQVRSAIETLDQGAREPSIGVDR